MRTFAHKTKATQQASSSKITIPARARFRQDPDVNSILHSQRTIGNQAVARHLEANTTSVNARPTATETARSGHDLSWIPVHASAEFAGLPSLQLQSACPRLQAKLTISEPKDDFEREADRIADTVVRMPEAPMRQGPESAPVKKALQMKQVPWGGSSAPALVESNLNALRGSGRPLPETMRLFMEPRFGFDFSRVRIHTDDRAAVAAKGINARAFTIGRDVVFGAGQYQPESREGRRLLAHELAHVVQQDESDPAAQPDLLPKYHSTNEQWIQRSIDVDEESARLEQENGKPKDLDDSKAAEIGREVLRTIGYDKLIEMAIEGGLLERRAGGGTVQRKPVPSHDFIQRDAVTWGAVFGRWAVAAGVTSQLDSPAPGPADLVALGILAVGVVVATTTVLMAPAQGNVADTGIMGEVNALIAAGTAATVCAALELLMAAAKSAGDTDRINRIKATQKAKGCRHSRHSG